MKAYFSLVVYYIQLRVEIIGSGVLGIWKGDIKFSKKHDGKLHPKNLGVAIQFIALQEPNARLFIHLEHLRIPI